MTKDEAIHRYRAAAHAMQSGVAWEMEYRQEPTTPKHLRVGVNSALVDQGGLVKLLIAKGIFTEEEYFTAICEAMEEEVKRYEVHLREISGLLVTLA